MSKFNLNNIFFILILSILVSSCTEQYVLQTNTFEDALVVEATITNEFKKQQIKITRTYRFEDSQPTVEIGATVFITDNMRNQYDFERQSGIYVSTTEFKAEPERAYRLNILTNEGRSYTSTSEILTTEDQIDVEATVENKEEERGVQINVKSYDPTNTSKYYRYEYEETYKIIAPYWDSRKTIWRNESINIVPRETETKTCYSTKKSTNIIQISTGNLSEDRVNHPVRFISNQDYIITHRYSILVRQYVQSLAAYTFYKTLKELSGSESILSQNQPGFFYGNLSSIDNPNEKVIGFFDVSSVSSKRIFFNYEDLFPGETPPPYVVDCEVKEFRYCFESETKDPVCKGAALESIIRSNSLVFYESASNDLYYYMVPPECGDCTTFSANITPSFWVN